MLNTRTMFIKTHSVTDSDMVYNYIGNPDFAALRYALLNYGYWQNRQAIMDNNFRRLIHDEIYQKKIYDDLKRHIQNIDDLCLVNDDTDPVCYTAYVEALNLMKKIEFINRNLKGEPA